MFIKTRIAAASLLLSFGLLHAPALADDKLGELLAFIGQKVSLTEHPLPPCDLCVLRNAHFVATYRILDTLHGNHRGSTITFDVYDHYGVPGFSKFDTVLLYLRQRQDGSWVHEKYQFNDLYKGVDDEWYGCGDPYARFPQVKRTVQSRPVEFAKPVSYNIAKALPDFVKSRYPAEYFDVRNGEAICKLGTSAADLLKAKLETSLAPRPQPK